MMASGQAGLRQLQPAGQILVYIKPDKIADAAQAKELAQATVVIHEQLKQHPDGIWVRYANGHMEFAATAADLAACDEQLPIVRTTVAKWGNWFGPSPWPISIQKRLPRAIGGTIDPEHCRSSRTARCRCGWATRDGLEASIPPNSESYLTTGITIRFLAIPRVA